MPFYTSRAQRLHYELAGEGAAVLLVHGFTNYGLAWTPQLGALVDAGYRVLLPDLAGHGLSQPAEAVTTVPQLAQDMAALLNHLDLAHAAICGLSLGGMVVQQLAVDWPSRVRAMIVANSRPNANTPELEQAIDDWIAIFEQPDGPRLRLEASWPLLVSERFRQSLAGEAALTAWRLVLQRLPGASLANVARGMRAFDVVAALPTVAAPTLVISGDRDQLFPPPAARRIAELVPGARFELIPGAGHLSNMDSPQAFNALVLDFLSTLPNKD